MTKSLLALLLISLVACNNQSADTNAAASSGSTFDKTSALVYMPFDEDVGATTFANSIPSGPTPTCAGFGCPHSGDTGQVGNSVNFDGYYMLDFSIPSLDTTAGHEVTFAGWLYWSGANYNTGTPSTCGIGRDQLASFGDPGLAFHNQYFGFTSSGCDLYGFDPADLINTWTHLVAVVHNGDMNQSRIYINGQPQALSVVEGSMTSNVSVTSDLAVGDSNFAYFGKLDEMLVYNHGFTDDEALDLYNSYQ